MSETARSHNAKTSAENRRCPMCDRGGALGKEHGPVKVSPRSYGALNRYRRICRDCNFYMEYERN